MDEQEFLASYDPRSFDPVAVTVDVVTLTIRDGELDVLLVERGVPPFEGQWALPGGFVRPAAIQDLDDAAARELVEETGQRLERIHLEQLATYGAPDRDPRMRVISVAYLAFAPELPEPQAGSDARAAAWVPVSSLGLAESGGQRPGDEPQARVRPRADPGRRAGASPLQAGVHAAGDRVRSRGVHDLRAARGLRDGLGGTAARGELPPQGAVGAGLRGEHGRDHRDRRAARRAAGPAVPPRGRAAAAPGLAAARA